MTESPESKAIPDNKPTPDIKAGITLSPEEKARQGRRSRAIGLAIAGLVVMFYLITVFKMGPAIMLREL